MKSSQKSKRQEPAVDLIDDNERDLSPEKKLTKSDAQEPENSENNEPKLLKKSTKVSLEK